MLLYLDYQLNTTSRQTHGVYDKLQACMSYNLISYTRHAYNQGDV